MDSIVRIARRVSDKAKAKSKVKKPAKKPAKKPDRSAKEPTDFDVPDVSGNILDPGVEYSFKVDMSFSVDFEGDASEIAESRLRKKLKAEILAAMKGAALMTADDFGLRASSITISPISITSAINDQTSVGEKEIGNV